MNDSECRRWAISRCTRGGTAPRSPPGGHRTAASASRFKQGSRLILPGVQRTARTFPWKSPRRRRTFTSAVRRRFLTRPSLRNYSAICRLTPSLLATGPACHARPPQVEATSTRRSRTRAKQPSGPRRHPAATSLKPVRCAAGASAGDSARLRGRSALRYTRSLVRFGRLSGRPVSTGTRYIFRYSGERAGTGGPRNLMKNWRARRDSNPRPTGSKPAALSN